MDVFRGAFWGSIWNNSFRFRYSVELLIEAEIFVDRFIWIGRIRDVFRGAFWGGVFGTTQYFEFDEPLRV